MPIDIKTTAEDILSRHTLPEDESLAIFLSRNGESIALKRDATGAPDVTYSTYKDGKEVALHGDEVVITDRGELRFYKFDEGGMLARAERLFTSDGKVGEGLVDEAQRIADETLIKSVRLMYSEAMKRADDFEVGQIEV